MDGPSFPSLWCCECGLTWHVAMVRGAQDSRVGWRARAALKSWRGAERSRSNFRPFARRFEWIYNDGSSGSLTRFRRCRRQRRARTRRGTSRRPPQSVGSRLPMVEPTREADPDEFLRHIIRSIVSGGHNL